jgi:hypothetical protein
LKQFAIEIAVVSIRLPSPAATSSSGVFPRDELLGDPFVEADVFRFWLVTAGLQFVVVDGIGDEHDDAEKEDTQTCVVHLLNSER